MTPKDILLTRLHCLPNIVTSQYMVVILLSKELYMKHLTFMLACVYVVYIVLMGCGSPLYYNKDCQSGSKNTCVLKK